MRKDLSKKLKICILAHYKFVRSVIPATSCNNFDIGEYKKVNRTLRNWL